MMIMKKFSLLFSTKNIVTLLASILLCFSAFAQHQDKIVKVDSETPATAQLKMISPVINLETAKEGTYQIVRIIGEPEDVVPRSLIDQIESYRTQDQIIYIQAGENTWIKILSYDEILAPDFKPVAGVVYIEGKLDK